MEEQIIIILEELKNLSLSSSDLYRYYKDKNDSVNKARYLNRYIAYRKSIEIIKKELNVK